jgi:hypothetical protein
MPPNVHYDRSKFQHHEPSHVEDVTPVYANYFPRNNQPGPDEEANNLSSYQNYGTSWSKQKPVLGDSGEITVDPGEDSRNFNKNEKEDHHRIRNYIRQQSMKLASKDWENRDVEDLAQAC